jgi:hypothetical protein
MVPEFDQERVYVSDIKKMISWYNMLLQKELLDFSEKEAEETSGEPVSGEQPADEKDTVEPGDTIDPEVK